MNASSTRTIKKNSSELGNSISKGRLSQQEMAKSLGMKQGNLSNIERGKTTGLSKRIGTLLHMIYKVNMDYLYNSSDEMFLRRGKVENVADSALSRFSKKEITQYVKDHEAEFRKHSSFRAYMRELIWHEVNGALRLLYLDKRRSDRDDNCPTHEKGL